MQDLERKTFQRERDTTASRYNSRLLRKRVHDHVETKCILAFAFYVLENWSEDVPQV